MTEAKSIQILPGRGLGWMTLGASLHGVISMLKAQPQLYPQMDLSYSPGEPLLDPLVLTLPDNGVRLRFDGPDQRLRLVEILDFSKSSFSYKNTEVVRRSGTANETMQDVVQGPSFRHVYNRLFGPSYAGEYLPPDNGASSGVYVLSYPGLAVRFSVKHKSWSDKADFVSILSSSAASPASSMAIFPGSSWPEARDTLYTKPPTLPRSIALASKNAENIPDEIEEVVIRGRGKVELLRRSSPRLTVVLSETTPQDLVAELGPPDAIFRKTGSRLSIHAGAPTNSGRHPNLSPSLDPHGLELDRSSSRSYTEDSESEISNMNGDDHDNMSAECFYNYFHHGFDILISSPAPRSSDPSGMSDESRQAAGGSDMVATKIFLHSNVPGSYSFNRHRRSRWRIVPDQDDEAVLTSEMRFSTISSSLKSFYHDTYANEEERKSMQRGMVLNRGWGESPESSIELLGGFEEGPATHASGPGIADNLPSLSNTELFGFPGLLFEVLKNDIVSCLTVY